MGIKYDETTKRYEVSYYKRHPKTGVPCRACRIGIKTEAEAKRVYSKLILQVEQKLHNTAVPTWEKFVEDFLAHCQSRDLTEKTVYDYGVCLRAFTFKPWGKRHMDSITTEEKSASHRQNLLKFIRAVFQYALECNHIQRNPAPSMKFQHGVKIKRVLTEEQAKLLLQRAHELGSEWYPHWFVALMTGMRNGELYALTKDKVSFETRQILVDSSWKLISSLGTRFRVLTSPAPGPPYKNSLLFIPMHVP